MRMKTIYTAILTAMTLSMTSCASNPDKEAVSKINTIIKSGADPTETDTQKRTVKYNLKNFHGICNNSNTDIVFTQGKEYSVNVTAGEQTLRKLIVEVESGILNISIEKGKNSGKAYFEISAPSLSVIQNNGIADIKAGKLDNSKINIENNEIGRASCRERVF